MDKRLVGIAETMELVAIIADGAKMAVRHSGSCNIDGIAGDFLLRAARAQHHLNVAVNAMVEIFDASRWGAAGEGFSRVRVKPNGPKKR